LKSFDNLCAICDLIKPNNDWGIASFDGLHGLSVQPVDNLTDCLSIGSPGLLDQFFNNNAQATAIAA
jgi:hypothetical protein